MQTRLSTGFTLIEIVIIAPIIILFIGAFIALAVSLTGESLQLQQSNTAAYNVQDALDDMEASSTQALKFLTSSGNGQIPQGENDGAGGFMNDNGTNPDALIISSAATTYGPYDPNRSIIYTGTGACNSNNPIYAFTTVYFVDQTDHTLYKRTILPQVPACAKTWQRGSCKESLVSTYPSVCKASDEKLLTNVTGMTVQYYTDGASSTALSKSQAEQATSILITLSFSKDVAGNAVTYSGSTRATTTNYQPVSASVPVTPDITFTRSSATPYTTSFAWDPVGSAIAYNIRYRVGSSTWINGPQNTTQTTYNVIANGRNQNVDVEVTVLTNGGSYLYGTKYTTIPNWNACTYQNGWSDYGGGHPSAGFTRTTSNVVMLKGLVKGGTTTAGTTICTLPAGFRPDYRLIFQVQTYGGTAGRLDIETDGRVMFYTGSNTWYNLSTVSFIAAGGNASLKNLAGINSWIYYGAPYSDVKLMKDGIGRGHLEGLAKSGSTTAYVNAFGDFSGGYAFTTGSNIYPAMHHGNTPGGLELNGNYVVTRNGMAGNGFWSLQATFYPTGSTTWQNATLANGWVNYSSTPGYAPASYTKGSDDIVSLQGLIKNGTVTSGTTIFTLPAGYRPTETTICSVITTPSNVARIDIMTSGIVMTREGVAAGWLSLAGCDFMAS